MSIQDRRQFIYGTLIFNFHGLKPAVEGFVVTMHEGARKTESPIPKALVLYETVRRNNSSAS